MLIQQLGFGSTKPTTIFCDKKGAITTGTCGHSDSDWGGSIDDQKSTGAYISLLLSAAISWKVKQSQMACLSSQEAEYCTLSEATKEALNL